MDSTNYNNNNSNINSQPIKKRPSTSMNSLAATPLNQQRVPLKETSGNIPSPVLKKAKLNKSLSVSGNSILQNKPNLTRPVTTQLTHTITHNQAQKDESQSQSKANRLEGEAFQQWQRSWRKIMRESVVYFDTQGYDTNNTSHQTELKKAQRALKHVGCTLVPFYDREVTIIVSRRPFDANKEYSTSDIFHDACSLKIKVWDYEKVFRFLKNLGVNESSYKYDDNTKFNKNGDLYNLLKEEKIFGANDRDPNARRDDLHYLEKNYLYAYDLAQNFRPIAVREWNDAPYPKISNTLDGKCPFIPDSSENLERRQLRRLQKFEASKNYRELLKKATVEVINNVKDGIHFDSSECSGEDIATDCDNNEVCNGNEREDESTIVQSSTSSSKRASSEEELSKPLKSTKLDFKAPPVRLARESSCVQPLNNSNSKFFEVAASGYNGASNSAQMSMDSALNSATIQGNGLGPTVSQVPSRNINNLKRRIFMKKQRQHSIPEDKERDLKPGYCENCRVKYNYFEDHISSNRHRNFACDDRHFKDIDRLIATLIESKSFGYVTSNGDYKYAN